MRSVDILDGFVVESSGVESVVVLISYVFFALVVEALGPEEGLVLSIVAS